MQLERVSRTAFIERLGQLDESASRQWDTCLVAVIIALTTQLRYITPNRVGIEDASLPPVKMWYIHIESHRLEIFIEPNQLGTTTIAVYWRGKRYTACRCTPIQFIFILRSLMEEVEISESAATSPDYRSAVRYLARYHNKKV